MQEHHYLVPNHELGIRKDLEYSIVTQQVADAEDLFVTAKERLLDVNNWKKYGTLTNTSFRLMDNHGKEISRDHARKEDHIRINITSGNSANSYGHAIIGAIEYDDYPDINMETFAMLVRPSDTAQDTDKTRQEGNNDATATFVIERKGRRLTSCYHGRNATGIAEWMGVPDEQWNRLIKGFI